MLTIALSTAGKSRTENWVSGSLVNLYTAAGRKSSTDADAAWSLRYTGVPVLLLDLGGSRSRGRGVRLVLAERGSGLALWYDTLDNLSAYAAQAGAHPSLNRTQDKKEKFTF